VFNSQATLTDASTITPSLAVNNSFTLALTASGHTLEAVTGGSNGQSAVFIINAGSGPYSMVFGTGYVFAAPYSAASPPALGVGDNVLTIVQQGSARLLSVLTPGTFS
jgi:hypothetical protein